MKNLTGGYIILDLTSLSWDKTEEVDLSEYPEIKKQIDEIASMESKKSILLKAKFDDGTILIAPASNAGSLITALVGNHIIALSNYTLSGIEIGGNSGSEKLYKHAITGTYEGDTVSLTLVCDNEASTVDLDTEGLINYIVACNKHRFVYDDNGLLYNSLAERFRLTGEDNDITIKLVHETGGSLVATSILVGTGGGFVVTADTVTEYKEVITA